MKRRRWESRACTMPRPLASPLIADRRRTDQRTGPPPSNLPGELPDEREHPHKLRRQECGKVAFIDGVEHVRAPSLAPHVHLLMWNRITARERERDGVEDDMRETEPVGAHGGPSTPPSGRDDEVTL
eukprot:scaffold23916_cov191-Isochrysis_galbana.AAC.1